MATPIPAFVAQWFPDASTSGCRDDNGSAQNLAAARWYYFVSNRTAASNGQSLLKACKDALDTSSLSNGAITWTLALTSAYKVKITSSSAFLETIDLDQNIATALGFLSLSNGVPAGTGVTADYVSPLFWSPDMPVSMTGPQQFDPSVSYGVPSSAGNVQRAPDMTAAAVSNGIQWAAEYRFNGVTPYYKVRKVAASSNHVNEDLETFWSTSLALGRRVLYWRDRLNLVGSNAPSEGTASPWNYVEYFPSDDLRKQLPGTPMTPYVLTHWDVALPLLVTENGETPLSD